MGGHGEATPGSSMPASGATSSSNSGFTTPAELLPYSEFHDCNTLDAQLGPRLQALQHSMQNPELSPSVRSILQTAFNQFERESVRNMEALPVYSADCRPPYE